MFGISIKLQNVYGIAYHNNAVCDFQVKSISRKILNSGSGILDDSRTCWKSGKEERYFKFENNFRLKKYGLGVD